MLAFLAFALATLSPADAQAIPAFMQAGQLRVLCGSTDPHSAVQPDAELCAGYVLGSVDQVLAEQNIWGKRRAPICLPQDVTVDQLKTVVVLHMEQKADQQDIAAATLVAEALKAAYPCGARRGGR